VQVDAEKIAAPGVITLIARNPGTPEQDSNTTLLAVISPQPILDDISPDKATTGGKGFVLTVTGSGFLPGSYILWDGMPLPTSVVDNGRATAQISADLLTNSKTVGISLRGPGVDAPLARLEEFLIVPEQNNIYLPTIERPIVE
jgi:hypothetical protein